MSTEKFRVATRLGVSAGVPALVIGELGYDVDTKNMRIGDGTTSPPKIATTKSTGVMEYGPTFTPKFANVEIIEGGKVDGVNLAGMNTQNGLVIRNADGQLTSRELTSEDDDFIKVTNGLGLDDDGPIVLTFGDKLRDLVNNGGGTVRFTWGGSFPIEDVRPGHLHLDDTTDVIYIRARQSDGSEFWMDIGTAAGGGGGRKMFFRALPPETAQIGDEWYDTEENRLFTRLIEDQNVFWVQRRI